VLSELQRRVATVFSSLDGSAEFALAGGGALIVQGIVDRQTNDLDYFTTRSVEVGRLLPGFVSALEEAGFAVVREQEAPGFARLIVDGLGDSTRVDLAADARLMVPVVSEYGLVLSSEELASDKVLAVFGRAEPRDFVDLAALVVRHGLGRAMELAAQKDLGFDVAVFRQMLRRFDRLPFDEFDLSSGEFERLKATVDRWCAELDEE
jgi:hypothetical protein